MARKFAVNAGCADVSLARGRLLVVDFPARMVAAADHHVSTLSRELGGDVGQVAQRLGIDGGGLHEAAWGRSQQMFWTVCDPHQWPGPLSAGAVAGAWLHGALCGAAAHAHANGTVAAALSYRR